ncbi:hypothetical protein Pfo_016434 [Paulownia fortunei]|nr:hypothetical protein Pfo_016434 [Paulownia fortunei]
MLLKENKIGHNDQNKQTSPKSKEDLVPDNFYNSLSQSHSSTLRVIVGEDFVGLCGNNCPRGRGPSFSTSKSLNFRGLRSLGKLWVDRVTGL